MDVNQAKGSSITPKSTSSTDTLWCPPNEDKRTLEQVGLQNVEGAPSELSREESEQYARFLMNSDSDIDA
jgi:hypothetical protein